MVATERLVEVPWCLARLAGAVLDVGSTQAPYVPLLPRGTVLLDRRPLDIPLPDGLTFLLAGADAIPVPDASFGTVLVLSTYEHVGMAHEPYGTDSDPAAARRVLDELWRVAGGRLLFTVPFGLGGDFGWFRCFDSASLRADFGDRWDQLAELAFFIRQGDEYLPCEETALAVVPYDHATCRANGVACLHFEKG